MVVPSEFDQGRSSTVRGLTGRVDDGRTSALGAGLLRGSTRFFRKASVSVQG